jgi:hypothetical protein
MNVDELVPSASVGQKRRDVDNGEFRRMAGRLRVPIRADEHMAGEKAVPGVFSDDANRDPIFRIGASEAVLHIYIFSPQVGQNLLAQLVEVGLLERTVHLAPPDVFLRRRLTHDELIVRSAPGVLARVDDQRPQMRDAPFAAPDGMFV